MKSKYKPEVTVQKGKIISNPPTMKQMPYPDRVKERDMEIKETRRGQTLDLHIPHKGKTKS